MGKQSCPDVKIVDDHFRDLEKSRLTGKEKVDLEKHVESCEACQVIAKRAAWASSQPAQSE